MDSKQQTLDGLADIFNRWQLLLASLSEEQINSPLAPSGWTVKDIVAHLFSWQQASVARAEAALDDRVPIYPPWWAIFAPDPEEDVNRTNAWLYEANQDKPWSLVYADWNTQFVYYLELVGRIPEKDFLLAGRYSWMGEYALIDSSNGSLGHHQEHYEMLVAWLQDHSGHHRGG
jgi:Mycothiol maleylpyruvate isomerase N-terminal domain